MKTLVCYNTHRGSSNFHTVATSPLYLYLKENDDLYDVVFLLADSDTFGREGNHLNVPCKESYGNLYIKTKYMIKYLAESDYSRVIKIDDDLQLMDGVTPEEVIHIFSCADLVGMHVHQTVKGIMDWHRYKNLKGNLDTLYDQFLFGKKGRFTVSGCIYSVSKEAAQELYPYIKDIKGPVPEDVMLSSGFERIGKLNMFTRIDTRHYLRDKILLDEHGDGNYKEYVGLYDHNKAAYPYEKGYAPKVSCICPTFGRTDYLEEAIWHFLGQDYPHKELIILNDNKDITYECDIPNVIVVNKDAMYKSLGVKRNAASDIASGHFLVPWDDDDIHLPHRISSLVKGIKATPRREFYTPPFAFFHTSGQKAYLKSCLLLPHIPGGAHATCIYSKAVFDKVGGYGDHDLGEDAVLFRAFRNEGVVMEAGNDLEHAAYVYNQGKHPTTGKGVFMPDLHRTVKEKGVVKLIPKRSPYTTQVVADMGKIFSNKRLDHDAWYKSVK